MERPYLGEPEDVSACAVLAIESIECRKPLT
jgi:hypothetical protein